MFGVPTWEGQDRQWIVERFLFVLCWALLRRSRFIAQSNRTSFFAIIDKYWYENMAKVASFATF
jgi:hypothetical protein